MTNKQRIEEVANTFRNYVKKGDKASEMLIENFTQKEIGIATVLYIKDHEMDYYKAMVKQRDKLENENLVREKAEKKEVMKKINLFTIGFAWICWLLALVFWGKSSWILLIIGVIPYLIQNQYAKKSNNSEDDEKNKNRA